MHVVIQSVLFFDPGSSLPIPKTTRQAIRTLARKHVVTYDSARQSTQLVRRVIRVVEANIANGRLTRFASARGQDAKVTLSEYIARVTGLVFAEDARVRALQDGDATEWNRLQALLTRRAYTVLRSLRNDEIALAEAPDFASETCWVIFNHAYPFDVAFDAWATTILNRRILAKYTRSPDVLNRVRYRTSLDASVTLEDGNTAALDETVAHPHADGLFEQVEDRELVRVGIAELKSATQRRLIQAVYMDGMTLAEFGAQEGIGSQSVYNLHHRALEQLRKKLLSPHPQESDGKSRQSSRKSSSGRSLK
ncbi:MAG: sigma-70 family RNA polymerase sigma factor [Chloroflexi bacterium]|nr:sigma-70 family RNA polymerase sigma factor [Chloroflexota bacterium]